MKEKTRRARGPAGRREALCPQIAARAAQPPVCAPEGWAVEPVDAVEVRAEDGASTDICFVDHAHPPSAKAGTDAETTSSAPATNDNPLRTGSPPFDGAGREIALISAWLAGPRPKKAAAPDSTGDR